MHSRGDPEKLGLYLYASSVRVRYAAVEILGGLSGITTTDVLLRGLRYEIWRTSTSQKEDVYPCPVVLEAYYYAFLNSSEPKALLGLVRVYMSKAEPWSTYALGVIGSRAHSKSVVFIGDLLNDDSVPGVMYEGIPLSSVAEYAALLLEQRSGLAHYGLLLSLSDEERIKRINMWRRWWDENHRYLVWDDRKAAYLVDLASKLRGVAGRCLDDF